MSEVKTFIVNRAQKRIWFDIPRPEVTGNAEEDMNLQRRTEIWERRANYPYINDDWEDGKEVKEGRDFKFKFDPGGVQDQKHPDWRVAIPLLDEQEMITKRLEKLRGISKANSDQITEHIDLTKAPDCSNHPRTIAGINPVNLAAHIANLHYESLIEFCKAMAVCLHSDGEKDKKAGRKELGTALNSASGAMNTVTINITKAWRACEKHMKEKIKK